MTGVDDAVILANQFIGTVFGYFAEIMIYKSDDAFLIGDGNDR